MQVYDLFGHAKEKGSEAEKSWNQTLSDYSSKYPEAR